MASSNEDLDPSPLDLLPPLPPSPPPSSLPRQAHSTTSSSSPSRPIPIEIYNHILHFAFGRHLPPLPLENRLDEPPSLAPLLPLTLVSKGLRELVLPFFYYHITIRKKEDWIQLLDPKEGLLVGEGEEETRRRGWIKRLSFARDHFPVASWTPSRDQPTETIRPSVTLETASLDSSGLGDVEEICIGNWGQKHVVDREIEAAVNVEMEGGPWLERMEKVVGSTEKWIRHWMPLFIYAVRSRRQASSLLHFLSQTQPPLCHTSLDHFDKNSRPVRIQSLCVVLHPPHLYRLPGQHEDEDDADGLARIFTDFSDTFPSLRFNLDLILEPFSERDRESFVGLISIQGWTEDEAGWWTRA